MWFELRNRETLPPEPLGEVVMAVEVEVEVEVERGRGKHGVAYTQSKQTGPKQTAHAIPKAPSNMASHHRRRRRPTSIAMDRTFMPTEYSSHGGSTAGEQHPAISLRSLG